MKLMQIQSISAAFISGRTNTGENLSRYQGLRSRHWELTFKGAGKGGAGEFENEPGNINPETEKAHKTKDTPFPHKEWD